VLNDGNVWLCVADLNECLFSSRLNVAMLLLRHSPALQSWQIIQVFDEWMKLLLCSTVSLLPWALQVFENNDLPVSQQWTVCAETGAAGSETGRRWTQVYRGDDQVFFKSCWEAGDPAFFKNRKTSEEKDWTVYFTWRPVILAELHLGFFDRLCLNALFYVAQGLLT